MKIIELHLKGFKRLDLLGATELKYTPESAMQLFLGKNGIGKSSLLSELSPLPCEANELREGGFKQIKIQHRNKEYVLRYTLHKKLECNFICEGEEYNNGGTVKVQRDLIKEHFRYDTQIHDVMMGHSLLSNMGPQQRREWFVLMSKSDVSYAIEVYNRIRVAERDIRGAIKLNHQRLIKEQTNLPDQETINNAKQQSQRLKDELNHLLPFVEHNLSDQESILNESRLQLMDISQRLIDLDFNVVYEGKRNVNELIALVNDLKSREQQLKVEYSKTVNELTELQDIHQQHQKLTTKPLSVIEEELRTVRSDIEQHQLMIKMDVGSDVKSQLDAYYEVKDTLTQLLQMMGINPIDEETGKPRYSREAYKLLMQEHHNDNQKIFEITNKIEYQERLLKNYREVHDVSCPSCNHTFKPGINCQDIERVEKHLIYLINTLSNIRKRVTERADLITEYEQYISSITRLKRVVDDVPASAGLFYYLTRDTSQFYSNPRRYVNDVHEYGQALIASQQVELLKQKQQQLEEERLRRIAAEGSDVKYIIEKMVQLEHHLEQLKLQGNTLIYQIQEIESVIQTHHNVNDLVTALHRTVSRLQDATLLQAKYINNTQLKEEINTKQQQLALVESLVNQLNQSEVIIEQLESTTRQFKEEQHALQILTNLLSPQDGLIAESLIGFINQFLDQMFNVVEQIWLYSMRLYMDLGEEGIDLDYRFKVDIDGLEEPVKDVSRLSRGQKEIMDFVFKMLLMQHLDMSDYPLFMDEVGGSFDATHRDRLYRYIKLLIESNQIQQVFIISHIASSHEALTTADVCVLDMDATMVDSQVNRVLKLS